MSNSRLFLSSCWIWQRINISQTWIKMIKNFRTVFEILYIFKFLTILVQMSILSSWVTILFITVHFGSELIFFDISINIFCVKWVPFNFLFLLLIRTLKLPNIRYTPLTFFWRIFYTSCHHWKIVDNLSSSVPQMFLRMSWLK